MNTKSVANEIQLANEKVIDLLQNSDPYWIGMKPAIDEILIM